MDYTNSSLFASFRRNVSETSWRTLINPRMLGFGLNRAWVYLMFVGAATSSMTWTGEATPQAAFNISTLALFLAMFVPAFFSDKYCQLVKSPFVRLLGPISLVAGTLIISSATLPMAPKMAVCIVGGVSTGVGSAFVDLGYGELYRNVAPRQTCLEAPLSFLLAAAIYLAIVNLPPIAGCILTSCIPIVAGAILFFVYKTWAPETEAAVQPEPVAVLPFALRVGACSALVGAADGVVRAVFVQAGNASAQDLYGSALFWAAVITIVVIWSCALFSREFDLTNIYKIAVLIMAFFFQLLPIVVGTKFMNVLALAGYGTFNVLIWIILAGLSNRYRLSAVTVFGIGWSMITLGVFIGSWAGGIVCERIGTFSPQMLSAIALMATIAVLLSYMFILKDSDVERITAIEEAIPAQTEDQVDRKPKFITRCKEIAGQYGLTPRETEIMILYARGRSYVRMQEELDISRSTITTHLTHIYQKMDVHTKQEFIDLIEGRTEQ